MENIEKSNVSTLKQTPSTRILYINSNSRIKRPQFVTDSLTVINSDLIVKKLSKIEKKNTARRDLCIETDNCILRRHFKEKRHKRKRRKSKAKLGVERSSLLLLEVNSERGSRGTKNYKEGEIETVVDNLKMLLNKYIDKHKLEDDKVMANIRASFQGVLNRLTCSSFNLLSSSLFKRTLDKGSKSSSHRATTLNTLQKDQSVCQCQSHLLKFSKSNMCSLSKMKGPEKEINMASTSSALWCRDGEKPKIVTRAVKLKKCKDNKGRKIFLLCMNKSRCSLSSVESFEVLAISRKSTQKVKKGSLMATVAHVSSSNLKPTEKEIQQTCSIQTKESKEKLNSFNLLIKNPVGVKTVELSPSKEFICDYNENKNQGTNDEQDKICETISNPTDKKPDENLSANCQQYVGKKKREPVEYLEDHCIQQQEEEKLLLASNLQESSNVTIEETELNDQNEEVLCAVNKSPSEKYVKFLVTPIKKEISEEDGTANSLVKSLYDKNAKETGNIMTNKGFPQKVKSNKTKSYYQVFKQSFRRIKKTKVKKTFVTKRNKKKTRVNECHILRIENHNTSFNENCLSKQFQTVADYLSNFADKANITLDIVVKVQTQNKQAYTKPKVEPEAKLYVSHPEDSNVSNFDTVSEAVNNDDDISIILNKIIPELNIMTDLRNNILPCRNIVRLESKPKIVAENKKLFESGSQRADHVSSKLTETVSSSKEDIIAVVNNSTKSHIVEVIQLLDTAMSHDKYLQESDDSIETIETATCNNEVLTAVVNRTKAKIIAEVLDLLDNAVSHDKHLHNYYKSISNVTARKSDYSVPIYDPNKQVHTATEKLKEPEIGQILSDLKTKLMYLTAAAKNSYNAKKERTKTNPRKSSINYPCLGVTTYGGSIVCLEDIGYFVTRFSSASGFLSKDSNDSSNFFKVSGQDKLAKEENSEKGERRTSIGTQISIPFPKRNHSLFKPHKTDSYRVIESESIIKVTDMTSESKNENVATECSHTKATTCSLPSSRAIFELAIVDNIEETKVLSFVSNQINSRSPNDTSLEDTVNADAYLRISLPQQHHITSMCTEGDSKMKYEDSACSNTDIEKDHDTPTFGGNQLCYFLTAQHHGDHLENSSSIAIEIDSLISIPKSKLRFQTIRLTRRQAWICCLITFLPFAIATVLYYLYLYAYNSGVKARINNTSTSAKTTVSVSTTNSFNLKEYGL